MTPGRLELTIGVLALQGAFAEHHAILSRLHISHTSVSPYLVKTPEDLQKCDALIIPGGESTTIALLARLAGLLEPLKTFVTVKPVWGTCAGAILLSEGVQGAKKGGQDLLGGIGINIARNGWGSQVESFETLIEVDGLRDGAKPFACVFIRAPVVVSFIPDNDNIRPPIEVLARLPSSLLPQLEPLSEGGVYSTSEPLDPRTVVALRQGRHLLTTFHPELTCDDRFHEYFVRKCVAHNDSEQVHKLVVSLDISTAVCIVSISLHTDIQ